MKKDVYKDADGNELIPGRAFTCEYEGQAYSVSAAAWKDADMLASMGVTKNEVDMTTDEIASQNVVERSRKISAAHQSCRSEIIEIAPLHAQYDATRKVISALAEQAGILDAPAFAPMKAINEAIDARVAQRDQEIADIEAEYS